MSPALPPTPPRRLYILCVDTTGFRKTVVGLTIFIYACVIQRNVGKVDKKEKKQ